MYDLVGASERSRLVRLSLSRFFYALCASAIFIFVLGAAPGVSSVIGKDDRLVAATYAREHGLSREELQKRFGASGAIRCPYGAASGFLVGGSAVVVTARHVLFPEIDMSLKVAEGANRGCKFVVQDGAAERAYEFDFGRLQRPIERQRGFADNKDWVVARLTKAVTGVTPYRLPLQTATPQEVVTTVAAEQSDMDIPKSDGPIFADCKIRSIRGVYDGRSIIYETDCSQENGVSGGAVVRVRADGVEALAVSTTHSLKNCPDFRPGICSSLSIPIAGELLESVRRLASEN